MKMHEILESASAGATSAGAVAAVANPPSRKKKNKLGAPEAPQAKNSDGTAKNALDIDDNVMGSKTIKR